MQMEIFQCLLSTPKLPKGNFDKQVILLHDYIFIYFISIVL